MHENLNVKDADLILKQYLKPDELLSPLSDSIFKALFKNNKDSLKSLLNALLNLNIIDASAIDIQDSELTVDNEDDKVPHLDLYCLTHSNGSPHQIDVEVQLAKNDDDIDRFIMYLCKIHGKYFKKGISYKDHPVSIGLIIADFNYFPHKTSYISENLFYDIQDQTVTYDGVKFIIISLPKFLDSKPKRDCIKDQWLLFLKSRKREDFEMLKYVNKELEAAVNDLERLSQDDRAMIAYAKELRYSGQYEANIEAAKAEGIDMGKDLGRAEGIDKTARNMKKDGMAVDKIVLYTGLTREEIDAL